MEIEIYKTRILNSLLLQVRFVLWFQHPCGAQPDCEDPESGSGVLPTNPSHMGRVCVHIPVVNNCTGSRDRAECSELRNLAVMLVLSCYQVGMGMAERVVISRHLNC